MKKALQWILVLAVLASLVIINAIENNERPDRKLANIDYSGVISIDCGESEGYTDKATNVPYQADDTTFVQTGQIGHVSSKYSFTFVPQITKQLTSLRSFPIGKRNCYTLKPKRGKNNEYLIRAYFAYGNYDNKDKVPTFDLHLGVNNFTTIELDEADYVLRAEVIHFATTATIDLCLVDTNQGEPFISLLELWPLDNSVYQTPSTLLPLALMTRPNLGMSETDGLFVRYMDDIYGRSWFNSAIDHSSPINTTTTIALEKFDDPYKLPSEVLSTAVLADELYHSLDISKSFDTTFEYYVYLHFFDFVERKNYQKRIMNINNNGVDASIQSLTLPYWKPETRVLHVNQGEHIEISVIATSDSDLPAMLNAYEIYQVVPQPNSATQQDDSRLLYSFSSVRLTFHALIVEK